MKRKVKQPSIKNLEAELFYFSAPQRVQFCNTCKVTINSTIKTLIAENDNIKVQAKFSDHHFFQRSNSLMVFDSKNGQSFALIFDKESDCKKISSAVMKNTRAADFMKSVTENFSDRIRENLRIIAKALEGFDETLHTFEDFNSKVEIIYHEESDSQLPSKARGSKIKQESHLSEDYVWNWKPSTRKRRTKLASPVKYASPCTSSDESSSSNDAYSDHNYLRRSHHSSQLIHKPNYEVFTRTQEGFQKSNLVIFPDDTKATCYDFSWSNTNKSYVCSGCSEFKIINRALVRLDSQGNEFVEVILSEPHRCSLRPFFPSVYRSMKNFEKGQYELIQRFQNHKIIKKLVIFDEDDDSLCYEYFWDEESKVFQCTECEHSPGVEVKAKIIMNGGEEYVELNTYDMICKPQKYDTSNQIFRHGQYELSTDGKNLTIFHPDASTFGYFYVYSEDLKKFICPMCPSKATVIDDSDSGEYVLTSHLEHSCAQVPSDSQILYGSTNFEFKFHGNNNESLLIFLSSTKNAYNEFIRTNGDLSNEYSCKTCLLKRTSKRIPQVWLCQKPNGDPYVIGLASSKHVCQPIKETYQYMVQPRCFFFYKTKRSALNLVIYHHSNRGLCYQYLYDENDSIFYCTGCYEDKKKRCNALYCKSGKGDGFLKLNHRNHTCQAENLSEIMDSGIEMFKELPIKCQNTTEEADDEIIVPKDYCDIEDEGNEQIINELSTTAPAKTGMDEMMDLQE